MTQLTYDIKRGFDDSTIRRRLEWYLTSDFLAIDEMGKERFRDGDTFFRTELERLLKSRYEERMPTLLATNASLSELDKYYGATLSSMLTGKYECVMMEPGDFRREKRKKMRKDMRRGG
jgi:DNA replication protein DnaC